MEQNNQKTVDWERRIARIEKIIGKRYYNEYVWEYIEKVDEEDEDFMGFEEYTFPVEIRGLVGEELFGKTRSVLVDAFRILAPYYLLRYFDVSYESRGGLQSAEYDDRCLEIFYYDKQRGVSCVNIFVTVKQYCETPRALWLAERSLGLYKIQMMNDLCVVFYDLLTSGYVQFIPQFLEDWEDNIYPKTPEDFIKR